MQMLAFRCQSAIMRCFIPKRKIGNHAVPSRVTLPGCYFHFRCHFGDAWGLGVAAAAASVFRKQPRRRRPFTNIIGEVAELPQERQRVEWSVGALEDVLFVTP